MQQLEHDPDAELKERLKYDAAFYAKHHLIIRDRHGHMVPLVPNGPQLRFQQILDRQRVAGQPQRVIVLKARKHGISTWVQAVMSQRYTQLEYHDAIVVAHNSETGRVLFKMGELMWKRFPPNSLVPKLVKAQGGNYSGKRIEFTNGSSLLVDTAENLTAGAGGTPLSVHMSELALWRDAGTKLIALGNAVPDVPESMVVIESTARGDNYFKELWDAAEDGRLNYEPLFIPWFEHPDYVRPFSNDRERDEFEQSLGEGPLREDEVPAIDLMKDQNIGWQQILEKLHWRHSKILSAEINSDLKKWKQEYPSTAAEAFIVSGSRVFSIHLTSKVAERCKETDKLAERGLFTEGAIRKMRSSRGTGIVEVPVTAIWVPQKAVGPDAPLWKVWRHPVTHLKELKEAGRLSDEDYERLLLGRDPDGPTEEHVTSVDPASDDELVEGEDSAYHAVQVIDHRTREQVAVYGARQDSDEAARQAFMAALYFNRAWLCAERTGGYGLSMLKTWKHDYQYPFLYRQRPIDDEDEHPTDRLGWDTNRRSKPLLIDGAKELLRQEIAGLKDLNTALEMRDLVRLPNGRIGPPRKGYSDRFMAWAIGQEIAQELPIKGGSGRKKKTGYVPKNEVAGY